VFFREKSYYLFIQSSKTNKMKSSRVNIEKEEDLRLLSPEDATEVNKIVAHLGTRAKLTGRVGRRDQRSRTWVEDLINGADVMNGIVLYYDEATGRGYTLGDIIALKKVRKGSGMPMPTLLKVNRDFGELPSFETKIDYRSPPNPIGPDKFVTTDTNVGFRLNPSSTEIKAWSASTRAGSDSFKVKVDHATWQGIAERVLVDPNFLITTPDFGLNFSADGHSVEVHYSTTVWLEKTRDRLHFLNSFRTYPPDGGVFKAAQAVIAGQKKVRTAALHSYDKLVDASRKFAYSSGTLSGAVGRFITGGKVRRETQTRTKKYDFAKVLGSTAVPNVGDREPNITLKKALQILTTHLPLATKPIGLELSTNNLWELYLKFGSKVLPNGAYNNLMKVNITASSGKIWGPLKKGDTLEFDMVLASALLSDLEQFVTPDYKLKEEDFLAWRMENMGRLIPVMKSKSEVGEREKIETKWRLYAVFNNYVQLPLSIFLANIFTTVDQSKPLFKSQKNKSWSLLGWSAYHGGIQNLLRQMGEEATKFGFSIAVYSDNLWILYKNRNGHYIWVSMDGSSMECSITKRDFLILISYVQAHYWKNSNITRGWWCYLNHLMPHLVIDGMTVLEKVQLENVGQFSGTFGTAYLNTVKMIMCVAGLEKHFKNNIKTDAQGHKYLEDFVSAPKLGESYKPENNSQYLQPALDTYFSGLGVLLKVELVTNSTLFQWLQGVGEVPTEEVVQLDLLATDIRIMTEFSTVDGGIYPIFPVLAEQRLYKALAYNKLLYKDKTGGSHTNVE
jgi:hypothetical protein